MSTFVCILSFSNSLWVAMETMNFHLAHTNLKNKKTKHTFVSHPGGPDKQFGDHEKLPWGVQGNLNLMPG